MHCRCHTTTGIASPFPHLWCFPTRSSHQAPKTTGLTAFSNQATCAHMAFAAAAWPRKLTPLTFLSISPTFLPISNLPDPCLLTPACAPAVLCNAEAPGVREHVLQQLALLGLRALVRKLDAILNNSGDLGVKAKAGNHGRAAAHMQQSCTLPRRPLTDAPEQEHPPAFPQPQPLPTLPPNAPWRQFP